jgi:hypothetical protein
MIHAAMQHNNFDEAGEIASVMTHRS